MIRAILFDLDETLADSREAILHWWRGFFEALGHPFPEDRQHLLYTLPQEAIVDAFGLGDKGIEIYARYLEKVGFGRTVDGIRLKPGARFTLEWCRRRVLLGLATNRSSGLARLLANLKIDSFFDLIVSGETSGRFKPDPWGIDHVCERLRLDRPELLFVGDSPHDIEFAVNGGVRSVGVGDNWKHGAQRPTWTVEEIAALPVLLEILLSESP
jgi:phosphoglycolate phosphatase-like HAD superfamily hydrolase